LKVKITHIIIVQSEKYFQNLETTYEI